MQWRVCVHRQVMWPTLPSITWLDVTCLDSGGSATSMGRRHQTLSGHKQDWSPDHRTAADTNWSILPLAASPRTGEESLSLLMLNEMLWPVIFGTRWMLSLVLFSLLKSWKQRPESKKTAQATPLLLLFLEKLRMTGALVWKTRMTLLYTSLQNKAMLCLPQPWMGGASGEVWTNLEWYKIHVYACMLCYKRLHHTSISITTHLLFIKVLMLSAPCSCLPIHVCTQVDWWHVTYAVYIVSKADSSSY